MPTFHVPKLTNFMTKLFQAAKVPTDTARAVAASLVNSNLAGHDSHGVIRAGNYLDAIEAGNLDPQAQPVIAQKTGVVTMVDAQYTFGQVAARFAMNIAIEKAKTYGLAATGLYNSNHVGRLGEWVTLAADEGLIGLAFCNGGRPGGLVSPYGGKGRLLGTNPFAAAIPMGDQPPVVIDFATSTAAEGKVRVARNKGQPVPEGWIQDAEGNSSTVPADLYDGGALLPLGLHKGYCLSLLMDFMGGMLTGQGSPAFSQYDVLRNGIIFQAFSVEAFRPPDQFLADSATLAQRVKDTPPAPGVDEVLLPGEPEQRATAYRTKHGIPIDEVTWQQLTDIADKLNVAVPI